MKNLYTLYVSIIVLLALNVGTTFFGLDNFIYNVAPEKLWINYIGIEKDDIYKSENIQITRSIRNNKIDLVADFYSKTVCDTKEGTEYNEDWQGYYPDIVLTATTGTGTFITHTVPKDYPIGICTSTILVEIHIGEYKKRLKPLISKFKVYE